MRAALQLACLLATLWSVAVGAAGTALGLERYELEEEVEVYYLGKWMPAKVRDCNKKGEVLGEFTFANRLRHEIFTPEKVRHLYESGAMTRGRLWSDATGQFKVKAALLKIAGGRVDLRTEQSKELSVPIDKLSSKDQTFIKQFQQKAGLAALPVPSMPTITEFDTQNATNISGTGRTTTRWEKLDSQNIRLQLAADPVRRGLELSQAGVGFPQASDQEKLSSLIALGGPDNWMLASIGENASRPTRLMWVALAKESVKKIQMLPAGEMLIDYHAASRQMLTYSKRKLEEGSREEHPVLTVWQADPSTEEPKAVVSWNARLPSDNAWYMSAPWARFASSSLIVQRSDGRRILAWDVVGRRLAWTTPQDSFSPPRPALTAGCRYLLLPEESGLRIIDTATGAQVAHVPMNGCSGVAAHADGRLIAAANERQILLIDLTGEQATRSVVPRSVGSHDKMNFSWVRDDLLCFDQGIRGYVLFSLGLELPIWTYTFDTGAYWSFDRGSDRQRSIVDDHLVYAATFTLKDKKGLAVGAVALPGEKAEAAIAAVRREDFYAVGPGSKFRLEVVAMDHSSEIRRALEKAIADNGWVYDESATNVLKAEYKRGEPREVRYELTTARTGDRQVQSATIVPYIATLKLMIGEHEAWQTMSISGPPPIVSMKE
ncbi:MAG: SHD1 domain-containing protein, partial [Aureliella sp.]